MSKKPEKAESKESLTVEDDDDENIVWFVILFGVFGSKFWDQYLQNVEHHISSFYVDVKFKTSDEPINKPLYFFLMKYF